jgi:4-hydroxybenzoate polyprenyltransferase
MKIIMILWILATTAVMGFAGFMAYNDKEGWGWFLFVGVLMCAGFSYKEKDGDGDKKKKKDGIHIEL